MNNANLVGLRLGITDQVGMVGTGFGEASTTTEGPCVDNAGVYSVEGQNVSLQMTLRHINA